LFKQLALDPEPWTPADCIASWWHLGQFFAGDGTRELLQYRNLMAAASGAGQRAGRRAAPPGFRGPAPVSTALWTDDTAAVVGRGDISDDWVNRVNAFARQVAITPP